MGPSLRVHLLAAALAATAVSAACSESGFTGQSSAAKKAPEKTQPKPDGGSSKDDDDGSGSKNKGSGSGSKGSGTGSKEKGTEGKGKKDPGSDRDKTEDELGSDGAKPGEDDRGSLDAVVDDASTPQPPSPPPPPPPSPDITTDDLIAEVKSAATGLAFDGRQLVCLNWKTGVLRSQNLYEKFFGINFSYTVTSLRGPTQVVTLTSGAQLQLPGKWGDAICGANPKMPQIQAQNTDDRDNPPIVQIQNNGTEACYNLDDAEDGRPGGVLLIGADFGVQKCP